MLASIAFADAGAEQVSLLAASAWRHAAPVGSRIAHYFPDPENSCKNMPIPMLAAKNPGR
jgi:hypothetical protein